MEAKDTVINLDNFGDFGGVDEYHLAVIKENQLLQAEISFKAGYKEGQTDREIESQQAYEAGKDAGRKEGEQQGIEKVVKWVEEHSTITYGRAPLKIKWQSINPVAWQAFLKGINKEEKNV